MQRIPIATSRHLQITLAPQLACMQCWSRAADGSGSGLRRMNSDCVVPGVDDPDKAVRTLAGFTAIRTLSDRLAPNHVPDAAPFHEAHAFLRKAFPKVFSTLAVERVSREPFCWAFCMPVAWHSE